jgi:hypothetical protein
MNLNDLANLGQIVGAIGVMITLVYLAIQIRGNTRVVSAQARHALSNLPPAPQSASAERAAQRLLGQGEESTRFNALTIQQ